MTSLRRVAAVTRMPLVLGLMDGLLAALTLAGGSLLDSGDPVTTGLALRVAVFAFTTTAFAMGVADYTTRRAELVAAAAQLNLTRRGQLATTRLGRLARWRTVRATLAAAIASLAGALAPLLAGAALPHLSQLAAALAIAALAALGAVLAHDVAARPTLWAAALGTGGIAVTAIGAWLHIA